MIFNSLTFLVFFAVVLAAHQLPLPWTVKKLNLLLASYLFYAAWSPPFVLLLIVSACVDYGLARWMGRLGSKSGRGALLAASLVLNLGLLGFFKYGNFLGENLAAFAAEFGVHYVPPAIDVILPLGISFYTFETISYTIDVYRRRIEPWESFLDYALFLTFFPHLVAGPIVRADDFLPQCEDRNARHSRQFEWGLFLMVLGLFEKVVLADGILAPVADVTYGAVYRAGVRGCLGRDLGVRRPDLLRLRRLLHLRHRRGALPRLRTARQLPLSVRRHRVLRLLAALAHLAVDAGCATTSTSRSAATARAGADLREPDAHHAPGRALARRLVDLRHLGRPARRSISSVSACCGASRAGTQRWLRPRIAAWSSFR